MPPLGLAFRTDIVPSFPDTAGLPDGCAWFSHLPDELYEEQREFLARRLGLSSAAS